MIWVFLSQDKATINMLLCLVPRSLRIADKAIAVINSLGDNVTLDDVIDRLYLVRKIELGIAQADAGDVMEHEQFMAELEREDAK